MTHDNMVITIPSNQPLIGIPFEENGREVVRYFADETATQTSPHAIQEVLHLAGSWRDLSWEEMEEQLDYIRHQSKPTPPFTL
jgi:hypothetical protein